MVMSAHLKIYSNIEMLWIIYADFCIQFIVKNKKSGHDEDHNHSNEMWTGKLLRQNKYVYFLLKCVVTMEKLS